MADRCDVLPLISAYAASNLCSPVRDLACVGPSRDASAPLVNPFAPAALAPSPRALAATKTDGVRVLLAAADGPAERSILRLLKRRAFEAEWARTASELKSRADRRDLPAPAVVFLELGLCKDAADETVRLLRQRFAVAALVALGGDLDGERAARLLSLGVPSLNKPVSAVALVELALLLASRSADRARPPALDDASTRPTKGWIGQLEAALESYASNRALSQQQRLILRFYLSGDNDKQIAQICACSEATVYEHWRRMGKKAGGSTKADVIADFHRYLVGD